MEDEETLPNPHPHVTLIKRHYKKKEENYKPMFFINIDAKILSNDI